MTYNRLINIEDFTSEDFLSCMKEASGRNDIPLHRKYWEWGMGFQILRDRGYLNRDKIALGLGCGKEPFGFILSRYVKQSIRTDLLNKRNAFFRRYLRGGDAIEKNTCPHDNLRYEADRVSFKNLDACNMRKMENSSVDIVYSFSSIEHFGNRRSGEHGAVRCMQESERVLKKGGICIGSTEFQIFGEKHPEFFRKEDFLSEIVESHSMQPVEPFDFSVNEDLYRSDYYFPTVLKQAFKERCRPHDHLGVISGNAVVLSIFFAFIKE